MLNNTRALGIHPEKTSGKLIFSGMIPEYVWISNPKILQNHPGRIFFKSTWNLAAILVLFW